jgi:hypothetical protein
VQKKPEIQRCGCGGSCATCKGQDEELSVSAGIDKQVQRFWGDDEEEDGGSWWDSATEEVGSWFSGDETESGGSYAEPEDSGGSWWSGQDEEGDEYVAPWEDHEEESEEGGGSWWDDVSDRASDTWDDLWGDENEEADSDTEDSDWTDWLPDWLTGEDSEEDIEQDDSPDTLDIIGGCETEEGVGFGSGSGTVSVTCGTVANYNHGKPYPTELPNKKIKKIKVKEGDAIKEIEVFDAKGKLDTEFKCNPTYSLPPVPDKTDDGKPLKDCQKAAVAKFLNDVLKPHEDDHVARFKAKYDGKVGLPFDYKNIPVEKEDEAIDGVITLADDKRVADTNKHAVDAIDPFDKVITGMDC